LQIADFKLKKPTLSLSLRGEGGVRGLFGNWDWGFVFWDFKQII
jgi:hypothetical protein